MSDDEKKIFVDEDWKSKVQREKEEAKRKIPAAEEGAPEASADLSSVAAPEAPEGQQQPRFEDLMGMLATQALYALGAMPGAAGQQVMVDLDQAAFLIEMLAILEEKTRGNLTTEEADQLNEARREIDRIFGVRFQQVQEQAMRQSGIDPEHLKNPPQAP